MSKDPFSHLTEEEFNQLEDALALITILIGSADGEIDDKEITSAVKLTHIRKYFDKKELHDFYEKASEIIEDRIKELLDELPGDNRRRIDEVTRRLKDINPILHKLDVATATSIYKSLKSFAKHIAASSGGFLGAFSISREEEELIDLPMLDAWP